MANTGGTQVNVGIGVEVTPGTPVAATLFPKWAALSMQGVAEKSMLKSARGIRNETSDSRIRRKYGKGSIEMVPNSTNAAMLYYLALGSIASGSITDAAYTHTITVQNANASMKTATFMTEDGAVVTERYSNVVVNALNFDVSDDYAKLTADLIGGFPDTGTVTESYSQKTEYAYSDMTVKFGTSIANATSASATPLKSFSLNIDNGVLLDEAFLSGAVTPVTGGFIAGRLKITGSYSLQFADTVELAKYKANTKNAAVVALTGGLIGATSTEDLTFKIGKLILTSPPKVYNLDGIMILKQDFTVEYDATDLELTVVARNATVSY